MTRSHENKSTIEEIRARFDADVERFSDLESGQRAAMDAPLMMELVTRAAAEANPAARRVLDIGCGAGNNTLRLLERIRPLDCDLLDLSGAMLERAYQRVSAANPGAVRTIQGDFRTADLPEGGYDVILAAAVLHHLRDDADWETAFAKIFRLTAPGGSVWISDLVAHESETVGRIMTERYADHLRGFGGEETVKKVFAYIEREDSPRPVTFQTELLRRVGFVRVDLLHKNGCFAAFGAIRSRE